MGRRQFWGMALPGIVLLVAALGFALGQRHAAPQPVEPLAERGAHGSRDELGEREGDHAHGEGEGEHEEGVIELSPESRSLGEIRVMPVAYGALARTMQLAGEVEPHPNGVVRVGPFVSGRVTALRARVGDVVRAGQVLALVDSTEVAEARAAYAQARAELANAERHLASTRTLASSGVFTQKSVDEIREKRDEVASQLASQRVEYQGELRAAEAAVRVCQAVLERAASAQRLAERELQRRKALVAAGAVQYAPLEAARREMAEAAKGERQAQAALRVAELALTRTTRLFEAGVRSRRELEEAQAAHDAAEAELKRATEEVQIAGQVLAREHRVLDSGIYAGRESQQAEDALVQASRARAEAEASLHQAKQRLELAQSPERKRALAEMESRLAALESLLRRESHVAARGLYGKREVQAAETAVAQARTRLLAAENALRVLHASGHHGAASVPIVAPIGGRVIECTVNRGQVVGPQEVLFTIMDLGRVWVDVKVYEKDVGQVRVGQPVMLTASAYPHDRFAGRITYMGDVVDEKTRTLTVRCEVANPQQKLKPGMFVKAEVTLASRDRVLRAPVGAVQRERDRTVVFVAEGEGRFIEREVKLGAESGGHYEVLAGLRPGERIVSEGAFLVRSEARKGELAEAGHSH